MKNHRLKGIASEMLFAARWYELVEDESLSLISPTLDTGWDFMIASTGARIQVRAMNLSSLILNNSCVEM
jgi:hypothetical protein